MFLGEFVVEDLYRPNRIYFVEYYFRLICGGHRRAVEAWPDDVAAGSVAGGGLDVKLRRYLNVSRRFDGCGRFGGLQLRMAGRGTLLEKQIRISIVGIAADGGLGVVVVRRDGGDGGGLAEVDRRRARLRGGGGVGWEGGWVLFG